MKVSYDSDIQNILNHRYDNGGDFWATPDDRIYKGNPFSTFGSLGMLHELGVDSAVEFLLDHWETREPLGPCHWGIGSMFMQIEYPFIRYNLFYYSYALSFFEKARKDSRFREALSVLQSKLSEDGKVIVENPHRNLRKPEFCAKGEPSEPAALRYREILDNLNK